MGTPRAVGRGRWERLFATATERVVARSWATDRSVVIGDAAHAVHPIAGMGASLALVDAPCLGTLLNHHRSTPSTALADFERLRRAPVRRAQWMARAGQVLTFTDNPVYTRMRHALVRALGLDHSPATSRVLKTARSCRCASAFALDERTPSRDDGAWSPQPDSQ